MGAREFEVLRVSELGVLGLLALPIPDSPAIDRESRFGARARAR
jgi:hypothetical protein